MQQVILPQQMPLVRARGEQSRGSEARRAAAAARARHAAARQASEGRAERLYNGIENVIKKLNFF